MTEPNQVDLTPTIRAYVLAAAELDALHESWPTDDAAWRTALTGIIQRAADRATTGEGARA